MFYPQSAYVSTKSSHNRLLQALGHDDGVQETKNKLHRALRKTCAEVGILPSSYNLDNNQIQKANAVPFASGGYSDVWRGSYKGENVSIKAFRVYTTDNIKQLTKVLDTFFSTGRTINDPTNFLLGLVQGDCRLPQPLPSQRPLVLRSRFYGFSSTMHRIQVDAEREHLRIPQTRRSIQPPTTGEIRVNNDRRSMAI